MTAQLPPFRLVSNAGKPIAELEFKTTDGAQEFLTNKRRLMLGEHVYGVPSCDYRPDAPWTELQRRAKVVFRQTEHGLVIERIEATGN